MLKILTIVGARPQFIKAAAISRVIRRDYGGVVSEHLVHTGQHYDREMSEVFFSELEIPEPAFNLGIGSGLHGVQTGAMLKALEALYVKEKPAAALVYGDTNSTLAGALAASKLGIPVIHVEAGLRSFNKQMPEEINRVFTDHVSTLLFSPTEAGISNLEKEGVVKGNQAPYTIDNPGVFHTGDIMYDINMLFREKAADRSTILEDSGLHNIPYILATLHRPHNTDSPERLKKILESFLEVAAHHNIRVVLPLHPRTQKKLEEHPDRRFVERLTVSNGIQIIPAMPYLDMVRLESGSKLIATDSGGVQKEAWFMQKPLVVLRSETEWTEIIDHGNGVLADADPGKIIAATGKFLSEPPSDYPGIYGNGHAAEKILEIVTQSAWK